MAAVAIGSEEETRCSKDPRGSERKRHEQQHEVLTQHSREEARPGPVSRMLLLTSCTEGGWEGHETPLCHEETVYVKGREVALFRPAKGLSDPGLHALSVSFHTILPVQEQLVSHSRNSMAQCSGLHRVGVGSRKPTWK